MKGLLIKDLCLLKSQKKILPVYLLLAVWFTVMHNDGFGLPFLMMMASILMISTISYDELDHSNTHLFALPFDRKTYVLEKYLFSFLMTAGAWCVGAVLYFAGSFVSPGSGKAVGQLVGELPMLLALIPVLYLSAAVMIPIRLKYGSEKSRTVLFIIFGIIAVLIFGINNLPDGLANPFSQLAQTLEGLSPAVILLTLFAVSAVLSGVSCLWSIRIMENKEF